MQDNGKGFDQQTTKKGLGFNNIVNRVNFPGHCAPYIGRGKGMQFAG